MTNPLMFHRRSFIHRKLAAAGAQFGEADGTAVALHFGDPPGEALAARDLGLADLSPLPRTGFKGAGNVDWLTGQGIGIPADSNWAERQPDGALVARLAPQECLILGATASTGTLPRRLDAAWQSQPRPPAEPRGYPVPRQDSHFWFLLTGRDTPAMLAKLCGVDLRDKSFPVGAIAQTSVARLSTIVIRDAGRDDTPVFHLLADSASAGYFWECLEDAMAEFGGRRIGLEAVRAVAGPG